MVYEPLYHAPQRKYECARQQEKNETLPLAIVRHKIIIATTVLHALMVYQTFVGFTLQAKLVSSKPLTQVHLKIFK